MPYSKLNYDDIFAPNEEQAKMHEQAERQREKQEVRNNLNLSVLEANKRLEQRLAQAMSVSYAPVPLLPMRSIPETGTRVPAAKIDINDITLPSSLNR